MFRGLLKRPVLGLHTGDTNVRFVDCKICYDAEENVPDGLNRASGAGPRTTVDWAGGRTSSTISPSINGGSAVLAHGFARIPPQAVISLWPSRDSLCLLLWQRSNIGEKRDEQRRAPTTHRTQLSR